MKRTFIPIVTLGWLLAAACGTHTAFGVDVQSSDILPSQNFFNPNRGEEHSVQPPKKVAETFTLVGIMSYEKGRFAFFDSKRLEFRKTLKASDTIAGYKIMEISKDGIKLVSANNQTLNVRVGMQIAQP